MAVKKPLVNYSGSLQEIASGDSIVVGSAFPFFKTDTTASNIALAGGTALPFYKADNTQSNITVI